MSPLLHFTNYICLHIFYRIVIGRKLSRELHLPIRVNQLTLKHVNLIYCKNTLLPLFKLVRLVRNGSSPFNILSLVFVRLR